MKEFEKTPLWLDVRKIFNSVTKPVKFRISGILHTEDEDIDIVKIIEIDNCRDYVNNIGDVVFISFIMPLGDYAQRFYPYRANLELTIVRELEEEVGNSIKSNQPILKEKYKAIFLPDVNMNIRANELESKDRFSLNLQDIVTVKLQLMNRSLEPLRIKTVGGTYQGYNQYTLIRTLLGGESLKVLVEGKKSIDGIDVVAPDNVKIRPDTLIPHGTLITSIPTFLQEKVGGVYNAGIGTYLQSYNDKLIWFVYPLFRTNRFDSNVPKVVFYATPGHRYGGVERTYRVEDTITYVSVTGNKTYVDSGETDLMNAGSGFKMIDASKVMSQPVSITPTGPVGDATVLNYSAGGEKRSDGLNYHPTSGREASVNPYIQSTAILQRQNAYIYLTWENSNPSLLYPGMPCKYVYLDKYDRVKHVTGTILFNHTFTRLTGQGISSSSYITSSMICITVTNIEADG